MNIYEKLQAIRVEMNQKTLKKSGYNSNSKFSYYELKDFLPQVMVLFEDKKLFSKFDIQDRFIEEVSVWKEYATLTITNAENPEEVLIFESPTAEVHIGAKRDENNNFIKGAQPIQNLGGKHSYLKRYLYQNAIEIIEADSVDRSGDIYEIYNGINLPKKEAFLLVAKTIKGLLDHLGSRNIDLNDLFKEMTYGGNLKDASVIQLLKIEKEIAKANYKAHKWFDKLYGTNSRIKTPHEVDKKIEYQTSNCKFGVMAYEMSEEEDKSEVIETYQKLGIDIVPFLEV